jgi:glucose-6-phosphate 1-dehydrogenase
MAAEEAAVSNADHPSGNKVRAAPPGVLVVFGASGDLTSRKLMPALAGLATRKLLPEAFAVVGIARTEMSDDDFRTKMLEAVSDGGPEWEAVVAKFRYVAGEYDTSATFDRLKEVLDELDRAHSTGPNRTFYLSIPPMLFEPVIGAIGEHGLNGSPDEDANVRVVIEKPYGRDLESERQLDACMHRTFREEQVYRIDHYLGKETVQNVLALRFSNAIFEPIWNRNYVDSIQITVAESLGVGHRGGFYESAGALRDIVQNHVLQVLSLTLMEPPVSMDPKGIRDEKVKALRAIDILSPDEVVNEVVRAQYTKGEVPDEGVVPGYREETDVAPDSQVETYVAMKLMADNWRWAGVPIFIRTGKRLKERATEIVLTFKAVPHLPFVSSQARGLHRNELIVRIQPDEGITLNFGAKVPGQAFEVRSVSMDFTYAESFHEKSSDGYERLLLDAMVGDPTLFIRADEVEQAWRIVDPILEAWKDRDVQLAKYHAGSWGPREADRLLERDGHHWHVPGCPEE